MTLPKRAHLRLAAKRGLTAFDGAPNGVHQRVIAEGLGQELDGPRFHGLNGHRHVAVTRDEDDGHVGALDGNALLQFETGDVRKDQVENQAARGGDSWTAQELLGGREYLRLPSADEISNSSDSRTEGSSSTTNTVGMASVMDDGLDIPSSARVEWILFPPVGATNGSALATCDTHHSARPNGAKTVAILADFTRNGPRGIENKNVAPGPSLSTAHKRPQWLSMIERLTDRPMPMPSLLVV